MIFSTEVWQVIYIYIRNRIGPKILPCGIPLSTENHCESRKQLRHVLEPKLDLGVIQTGSRPTGATNTGEVASNRRPVSRYIRNCAR